MPPRKTKYDWQMWTCLGSIILVAGSWVVSVEVRMLKSDSLVESKLTKMDSKITELNSSTDAKLTKADLETQAKLARMDANLSLSDRVKNLENLLVPLLVDWKVKQEMNKVQPGAAAPEELPPEPDKAEAQHWAEAQVSPPE